MTVEKLIDEALCEGLNLFEIYDYTFGELVQTVNARKTGRRRLLKTQAVIAMRQAKLTAIYFGGGGKELEVYDVFDFWSKEEIEQAQLEKWKKIMFAVAAKGGKTNDG